MREGEIPLEIVPFADGEAVRARAARRRREQQGAAAQNVGAAHVHAGQAQALFLRKGEKPTPPALRGVRRQNRALDAGGVVRDDLLFQRGERRRRAAHGDEEGAGGRIRKEGELFADQGGQRGRILAAQIFQPHGADVGAARIDAAAAAHGQFGAGAAHVDDAALPPAQGAGEGGERLALAAEHVHVQAAALPHEADKFLFVARAAHGGRGKGGDAARARPLHFRAKTRHGIRRARHRLCRQFPRAGKPFAQTGRVRLFIQCTTVRPQEQADGVGTDINRS